VEPQENDASSLLSQEVGTCALRSQKALFLA
jgi:hypothetical protein